MVEVIDYRVSRILILCKDCDQDVGLYPARHKCGIPSSEAPLLSSIPNKYLSTGYPNPSKSNTQSNNNRQSDGLWNKLRTVRTWNDPNTEDEMDNPQGTKLWKTLLNAATSYNDDGDSDNESEKDEWEGETHISRILREYYEDKDEYLPEWLHDLNSNSDNKNSTNFSSKENNYRPPMITNLNDNKNRLHLIDNDISKNIQPKIYDRESMNYNSSPLIRRNKDSNRDNIMDKNKDRSIPPPNVQHHNHFNQSMPSLSKNIDSGKSIKQHINNTLPPQPSSNARLSDASGRLKTKKSHHQLRTGSGGQLHNEVPHIPTNRSKPMGLPFSSSHPQQYHQPPLHNMKGFNYGGNTYEGDVRGRQGVPPHGSGRNGLGGFY
ncbi:11176_t:CDS:2 [Funneliformis geosporum]|uniref:2185_t:CDS:1 n=1 Tax=Funneliformis geosporum TaxID=1117311 RepID=A0A9W4SFW0_9GLOM|nr:11176_t:CDS:2 [Funneliformis geosporum]CAI2168038.1 2185_t:CDS:2 [Funneliformis geosporum]